VDKRKVVVYLSGKYSTGVPQLNLIRARDMARTLWEHGYTCLCPHCNTDFSPMDDKLISYDDYIRGDLELLRRCDVIMMMKDWEDSPGAKVEHDTAQAESIPVFYGLEDLNMWYAGKPTATL